MLKQIAEGPPEERETALAELLIVAGLRELDDEVKREAKLMPIQESIMDHSVIVRFAREWLRDSSRALCRAR